MTNQEFINLIAPKVEQINQLWGKPLYNSVVIAQAILETGWGKSNIMLKANALFGIKATTDWKGKVFNTNTLECYDNINFTNVNACFRAYSKIEDSIYDYFSLICKNYRYKEALFQKTWKDCIVEIKKGGYATDPNYIEKIENIIKNWNLTRFDSENIDCKNFNIVIGNNYILCNNMNVRNKPSVHGRLLEKKELTEDGQKHCANDYWGVLKKGTTVTVLDVYLNNSEIWIKIPSGFICAYKNNEKYISEV